MKDWEIFEQDCINYLNKKYGKLNLKFISKGGSDSTSADIEVIKNGKSLFFIESKMPIAQSGQFVLLDSGKEFYYSDLNKSEENEFSAFIKDFINNNYACYKNVSTSSMSLNIDPIFFSNWIKNYYNHKKVKYIITKSNNGFVVFNLNKYDNYFSINGNFRRKKSGSRELAKKNIEAFKEITKIPSVEIKGKKVYVDSFYEYQNKVIDICGDKIEIREKNEKLEVRTLGNTDNPNVIFSISLVKNQEHSDLIEFENEFF